MKRVVFLEQAEAEFREAAAYYRNKVKGLGTEFRREVRRATRRIQQFPDAGALAAPGVRRCLLRRFPFAVLYRTDPECITVLAVMHLHRRPGYWRDRL